MMSSKELLTFVWEGLTKAIKAYELNLPLIDSDIVQHVINNSDVDKAKMLVNDFNLM